MTLFYPGIEHGAHGQSLGAIPTIFPLPEVEMGDGYIRLSGQYTAFRTLEVFVASFVAKKRLLLEQPAFYQDSLIMDTIRGTQGTQAGMFLASIIDIFRQTYMSRATYLLGEHEKAVAGLGDQSASGRSWEERREALMGRHIVAHINMNIVNMKRVIEHYIESVVVTHTPSTYSFLVQVISPKGIPPNLAEIQAAIERAKPAHLGYTIEYIFTTWDQLEALNLTWDQAEAYTWDQLEVVS